MKNRLSGLLSRDSKSRGGARRLAHLRRRQLVAVIAASGLLASTASAAEAAPPSALRVRGLDTTCPTAKEVATLLERMLLHTQITADAGPPGAVEATLSDQGAHFRVTVADQTRSFDDASRHCAERARHAAVFLALVLDPLMTAELSPAPPATQPPPVPPDSARPRPESRPNPLQWEMTIGGVMHVAPEVDRRQTAVAQGVTVFARAKRGLHLAFGAGVLRGPLHFDVATADAWWIPIELAAGLNTRAAAWEIGAELGPSASILSIVGEGLRQARPQVRLELGGRVSVWSRFWVAKQFAVFLSTEVIVRPVPHLLEIEPRGTIGQMPVLWLGASAGVAASFL